MKPRFATIFWSKASFESVAPVITERQSGAVANNAALVEDDLARQCRRRSVASHIKPIGGCNSSVPQARILYRALLVAKVRIDQPIALGITLRPLEVVEKGPGMKGTNPSSIGDRASQFGEHFAVPLDATAVGYAAVFFCIGSIEIPAAALGNFDDRVVVLP